MDQVTSVRDNLYDRTAHEGLILLHSLRPCLIVLTDNKKRRDTDLGKAIDSVIAAQRAGEMNSDGPHM